MSGEAFRIIGLTKFPKNWISSTRLDLPFYFRIMMVKALSEDAWYRCLHEIKIPMQQSGSKKKWGGCLGYCSVTSVNFIWILAYDAELYLVVSGGNLVVKLWTVNWKFPGSTAFISLSYTLSTKPHLNNWVEGLDTTLWHSSWTTSRYTLLTCYYLF